MRKTIYNVLALTLPLAVLFTGCVKDEDEPEDPNTTTTTGGIVTADFKWTPGSGNTVSADEAYYSTSLQNIYAAKNGTANSVEIILPDFSVGTYSIGQGNTLEFIQNSITYNATSGNVKITANTGSKINGNFSVALSGGTITSLSGQFTDVPRK